MASVAATSQASATSSIVKTLGGASGLDVGAIVTALVDAQFAAKTAALDKRTELNTARISKASELKSGIQGFATALASLAGGGTLQPAATSSDTGIVAAKTLTGQTPSTATTTLRVRALAAAQTSYSATPTNTPNAAQGTGTLTIRLGTATVDGTGAMTGFSQGAKAAINIRIDPANSTLAGIAAKVNAANAGVTASVVTDAGGSRLAFTGASGAASAFKIDVAEDADAPGLATFAVGEGRTGTTTGQVAADAAFDVNGVPMTRATNAITDAIPGIQLDLQSVNANRVVTIGAVRQGENLKAAVADTVGAFNEIRKVLTATLDPVVGELKTDPAARNLARTLGELASRQLIPAGAAGAPRSLAEIGVKTNRDGSWTLDEAALTRALAQHPAAVEQLFAAAKGQGGLSEALNGVALGATSMVTGLGASLTQYNRQTTNISEEREKATLAADALRTRLTQQFSTMDTRVAAYKSTQSFLTNQIAAWNKSDG